MSYVIGVDIGTQSTKAVLVGENGTIVTSASREYAPDTPRPNWAEQDAEVWQKAFEQAVAEVAVLAPNSVKAVASRETSSMGEGQCGSSMAGRDYWQWL
eukprot:Protomagalhaensia_wolfi_Nauph_80__631@NODE_135_length_3494_cov_147_679884_g36_i1_p3_GENE_NODE_135_length_3494_cov_147_679884_g36_i1NODE_135_length_3494_cov_147_679884_g36_i1_p3_ORF_typecomplete_len111_score14_95FGGY_N/PF00370_21/1_5e19ROK/PF00480_20/4_5e06BcrAD_BadFG/PF01869_20/6_6e05FKBP_N/PF01346_18/0_14_NODE_135_length_3494_cov_147_679884_g36_i137333